MGQRRWNLAVLAFCLPLTLGACGQEAPPRPAPPVAAPVATSAPPREENPSPLTPGPALIAPGQILVRPGDGQSLDDAVAAARDVLARLGVTGKIEARPDGLVLIELAPAASSATMEWDEAGRCPRIVSQAALERDIALAMRCAIARLEASRRFAAVEPNYAAASGFVPPPRPALQQQAAP